MHHSYSAKIVTILEFLSWVFWNKFDSSAEQRLDIVIPATVF